MNVSKEGKKFLIDMKVYLLTKGIKEDDINNFLEDAELHLIEGEKEGKTVTDIFGDSPKEYAEELAEEMEVDKRENVKSLVTSIVSIGGYWILNSILFSNPNHHLTISNVDLIGYPIILLLSIIVTVVALKMSSFKSKLIEFSIIYVMVMIPILLLVLIKFVDEWMGIPIIQLSESQSFILAGIIFLVLIIINFYLLRWIGVLTIILPISVMFIFEGLAKQNLYWSIPQMFLAYGSLALLFLWYNKMENKKNKV
ncbi:hypothetical protein BACCIP111899_00129 [Bacillus rhizoplanae]|uniref:HAAS transmembrane region domain-containing protein n=1 Tax=Bacillus rhizoplanae TaxID=2880966 RepID=A0ABM8Y5G7_9BACI|nr:DUF1129 domain-containing protein [Bacillus rhizoplanae]CAG9610957.1 hypothetical protein BACCIP111899_00129 [Bacillus rhizoplanae]